MAESERVEMRQVQGPTPQPLAIPEAQGAGLGDMAERIGALVAIG